MKRYNFDAEKIEELERKAINTSYHYSREEQLEHGDEEAQVFLALHYIENNEISLAKEYLESAADKGNSLAAYYYAYFWLTEQFGRYLHVNSMEIGMKYLVQAAGDNDFCEDAAIVLGFFYETGNCVDANLGKARFYYSKVLSKNPSGKNASIFSERNVANLKEMAARFENSEDLLEQNYIKASICYYRAAKLGDVEAAYKYALFYAGFKGIAKSYDILFDKLKNISDKSADACFDLGIMYLNFKNDSKAAFKYFQKACLMDRSNKLYLFMLGYFSNGIGVTPDINIAEEIHLNNSGFDTSPESLRKTGKRLIDEKTNCIRGFLLINIASELGDLEAKKILWHLYSKGRGIFEDKKTAFKLLQELSRIDPFCMMQLGAFLKIEKQYKKSYETFEEVLHKGDIIIANSTAAFILDLIENDNILLENVDDYVVAKCVDCLTKRNDGVRYLATEYQLAIRLAYGYFKGQYLNIEQAKQHLERISQAYEKYGPQNISLAERELALLDLFGYGVDSDYYTALEKLDKAIKHGDEVSYCLKELLKSSPCDFDFGRDSSSIDEEEVERAIRYFARVIFVINDDSIFLQNCNEESRRLFRNAIDEIVKKLNNLLRTLKYSVDKDSSDLLFICDNNKDKYDFIKEELNNKLKYEIRDKSVYFSDNTAVFIGETQDGQKAIYKFIKKQHRDNEVYSNEVRVMQELGENPGIIKLLNVGLFENFDILLLEYAEHVDSFRDEADAIHFAINVCSTLKYMSAKGFIHRDIKPQNLYKRYENNIPVYMLGDFGISKKVTDETVKYDGYSTPRYEAPEGQISIKSDLYSLGCCLYEELNSGICFDNFRKIPPDYCSEELFDIILGLTEDEVDKRLDVDTALKKLISLYSSKYGSEYDFLRI